MAVYNLFISHSWTYSNEYNNLVGLLNRHPTFVFKNYSVPKDDPVHNAKNESQLREAIKAQMSPCSCVLILAGVYSTYSKWINIEIDLAINAFWNPKKIIAIEPWSSEKTSKVVKDNADRIVGWNTSSVVDAIRALC